MSIKAKLSWFISLTVTIILLLNISIYYFSSKSQLQNNAEQQMIVIAKQIGETMESAQKSKLLIENMLGERLRIAAIAAKNQLDPDIDNVENEQLVQLSKEIGVDHITLWKRIDDDIVVLKSSDPKEINLSSKTWDYWFTAFNQLFDNYNASIPQGQKLPNFWSGPINFSTSDPNQINKWGSYFDGTTNYIINPFVNAKEFLDFEQTNGSEAIASQVLRDNPEILEVTGFDPQFVGQKPLIKIKQGLPVYNLDVRSVIFGQYTYTDTLHDVANIHQAAETGEVVTTKTIVNGKKLMKSFIPIKAAKPFVIGVSFDHSTIERSLLRQIILQSSISLGLIALTIAASSFIVSFMVRSLNQILSKVNEIAAGNFGARIHLRSKDELGLLASRVNTMSHNLHSYTTRLTDAAEELRNTKQYLESFVNHTSDAIHVSDLNGRIIQVNKAFETMYGWSEQEALHNTLNNVPEDYIDENRDIESTVMQGGSVTDLETVRYDKNGTLIDLSITVSSIRDESGKIIAIATISRNITARKQTEEVLRRSEKLSVVGQLAAGVAHEVRNPLTTLRGFVQLLQKDGKLAPSYLNIMLSELDRINFIVSEFLVFAKPQASKYQLANLEDIMNDIVMLLHSEANFNNILITTQFDEPIPPIRCEVNQLKQVFVNMMKNGMEAMPVGGELSIELTRSANGQKIIIRISDQGSGISEEDLQRLGEPFFTRKEEGNGLGIMISQQIIANHKGSMSFQSELGRGTCVEIILPLPLPQPL